MHNSTDIQSNMDHMRGYRKDKVFFLQLFRNLKISTTFALC
ncbi:hypothetical protein SAMN05421747_110118 [Parapedobacter composti]|uniref:Uncharacterized protein n=1 Tax=Parapedobacter composti TaxID=623281 RepID=A0A1I1J048_9SPHI|nr:hypothetical protein SAMN05421747_110118 [Parapedobacter composti]